jgi:hypothetical protein
MGPSSFESILGLPPEVLGSMTTIEERQMMDAVHPNERPKSPVVSQRMIGLLEALPGPVLQKWFWPDAHPFSVCLSHDVDEVRWSWRRRLLMGARHPKTLVQANEEYWNFQRIIQKEAELGLPSSWYFVADGRHPRDPPYRLDEVADEMKRVHTAGNEVGVHGSFLSFNDGPMLLKQRLAVEATLGSRAIGIRQHFINFEAPLTWKLQEAAGFEYDTTLAFNEHSGFRTGMCHPYRPSGRSILEIPLVLMDGQLFWYEKFDVERATANCELLARAVESLGGVLTMNWHQHTLDGYSFPGWWDVYDRILEGLIPRGPAFMTSAQISSWWSAREQVAALSRGVGARYGSWEIRAQERIRGLTLRIAGARSEVHYEADVSARVEKLRGEDVLVLEELDASKPAVVTATW